MDKTREAFEKTISGFYVKKCVENKTMEQAFYDNQFGVFKDGRQSRDKEIHRLEQIATENSDWFDALKIDFDKQKEENKNLREVLSDTMEYVFSGEVGARKQGTCFSDIIDRARQFLNTDSSENRVDSDFRL